jgi:hypothetical protein
VFQELCHQVGILQGAVIGEVRRCALCHEVPQSEQYNHHNIKFIGN